MDFKLELVVLPVSDVDRAKAFYADKVGFAVDVDHRAGEFRVVEGDKRVPGPDPQRSMYNSFADFRDPDGNTWVLQEARRDESGA
jgi:catechol 2,3-dioxygenase-like lactoylglutathione lyase family enzyme